MDFSISKEQTMLLNELDRFLKKEIAPLVEEYESQQTLEDPDVLKSTLQKLEPFGLLSGSVAETYGGMGLPYLTTGLVFQKIAECWGSLAAICIIQCICARLFAEIESHDIREMYLQSLIIFWIKILNEVSMFNLFILFNLHILPPPVRSLQPVLWGGRPYLQLHGHVFLSRRKPGPSGLRNH